ncbi:MAG: hypothetical protein ACOC6P_02770 [Candidatus Aminicenantaceae bacterium]
MNSRKRWSLILTLLGFIVLGGYLVLTANDLPQDRIFNINEDYNYPGTQGIGNDVMLEIKSFPYFTIESQAVANINASLSCNPSSLPLYFLIMPNPSQSGCPQGQEKMKGHCYPVEAIEVSDICRTTKTFSSNLIRDNGSSWQIVIYARARSDIPARNYHISGTIRINFETLLTVPPVNVDLLEKSLKPVLEVTIFPQDQIIGPRSKIMIPMENIRTALEKAKVSSKVKITLVKGKISILDMGTYQPKVSTRGSHTLVRFFSIPETKQIRGSQLRNRDLFTDGKGYQLKIIEIDHNKILVEVPVNVQFK